MNLDPVETWARRHCRQPRVRADFLRHARTAEAKNRNCVLGLGAQLCRGGKPQLVCLHSGELFSFELRPDQTPAAPPPNQLTFRTAPRPRQLCPEPVVSLEAFSLEPLNGPRDPIEGSCTLLLPAPRFLPWCMGLEVDLQGNKGTTAYWYSPGMHLLRSQSALHLRFASPCGKDQDPWSGTAPAFLRVYHYTGPGRTDFVPISGVLACLLEIPGEV